MRVQFSTTAAATRAAKRLKRMLSIPESTARQLTAFTLGYQNWHELEAAAGTQMPSLLDEDCGSDVIGHRRRYQEARLREGCAASRVESVDVERTIAVWQPSAARPQEQVQMEGRSPGGSERIYAEEDDADGQLSSLLAQLNMGRATLEKVVDRLLVLTSKTSDAQRLDAVESLAVEAIVSGRAVDCAAARRLLEVLAKKDIASAWFNLAASLMQGHGGPKDEKRGLDLFQRVANCEAARADLRQSARSLVASGTALGRGRSADVSKAVTMWEAAAEGGNDEAAFNAGIFHEGKATLSNGRPSPTDTSRAARFYRLGAEAGHVMSSTNLGILLLSNPHLAEERAEALLRLEWSAERGDKAAIHAVTVLHQYAMGKL